MTAFAAFQTFNLRCRTSDLGRLWSFAIWHRLSVEGGAFVGREPTVGPTWATKRGLYKRARDGPGGTK